MGGKVVKTDLPLNHEGLQFCTSMLEVLIPAMLTISLESSGSCDAILTPSGWLICPSDSVHALYV